MALLHIANTEAGEGKDVEVLARDTDEKLHHLTVHGQEPYFYTEAFEDQQIRQWATEDSIESIESVEGVGRFMTDHPLATTYRVQTETPIDVRDAREDFEKTYNADVQYTNRFRIDNDLYDWFEVPDDALTRGEVHVDDIQAVETDAERPRTRVCTFDIEVDDRGDFPESGERRIVSIVAHDNYTDETVGFVDLDGRKVHEVFDDRPEGLDELQYEDTERKMLIRFGVWVQQHQPDILTGWNSNDFDIPYVIDRFNRKEVSPGRLSPISEAYTKRSGDPVVRGVACYDMFTVYQKNTPSELDSYSLDDVGKEELGEEKVHHEESIYEMWQDDVPKLMDYNTKDVALVVGIDEVTGALQFREELKNEVGVDWRDSLYASDFIEMLVRRKMKEFGYVGPTVEYGGDEDFEGGQVFDPYNGVREDVISLDVSSLYPMTIKMLNISPETKVDPATIDDAESCYQPKGGTYFTKDREGLFAALVDDALVLKADHKEAKRAATPDTQDLMDNKYMAAKQIVNSIFGVLGWENFFAYDRDCAKAITLSGQHAIYAAGDWVEDEGDDYELIYGDTDSVYVGLPPGNSMDWYVDEAHDMAYIINDRVFPEAATELGVPPEDCLWDMEVEAYMPRFFQAGKKKRYAFLARWDEGTVYENGDVTIKGFSSKRSDSSALTTELEKGIIEGILRGAGEQEVTDMIYDAAQEISGDPNWARIGIPRGIGKALHEYDSPGAHERGALVANEILGKQYGAGSKPKRVYIEPTAIGSMDSETDVICYDEPSDLAALNVRVDVNRMTDKLIVNPLDLIVGAIGVDVEAAITGQMQQTLF